MAYNEINYKQREIIMNEAKKCSCCSEEIFNAVPSVIGEYVCYCSKVTEADIAEAMQKNGANTVEEVIQVTGAMKNCNCKVNNPKGTCCYPDVVQVFNKYKRQRLDIALKKKFENPVRLLELSPSQTLLRIGLQNGQIVCDIGAGSGIFTIPAATLTENTVFALEINDELIPVIREKAGALNLGNVQVLKVEGNDFGLETGSVDLALLVAIFHEISNKEQFLEEVVRILADHGKVAVIEFHKRDTPMGPPLSHRVSRNALLVHFEKAGSYLQEEFELGPNYYCAVLQKDSTRKKAGLY